MKVVPNAAKSAPADREREDTAFILSDLVNHLDAMIAYWDADQICVFANEAYVNWFGKRPADIIGASLKDLLGPTYERNLPYILAAYAGTKQVFERAVPHANGSIRHSLATYLPRFVDGKVHGIYVHVADVGPLKQLLFELNTEKERAEFAASHDLLTALPNRSMMAAIGEQAIERATATATGFALLAIDIDNFRSINVNFGSGAGDLYLKAIADRIVGATRDGDRLIRLGGDEFLLVANKISSFAIAGNLAARILAAARKPWQVGSNRVLPSISIGISLYPQHGKTLTELHDDADRALFAAKQKGRNSFLFISAPSDYPA